MGSLQKKKTFSVSGLCSFIFPPSIFRGYKVFEGVFLSPCFLNCITWATPKLGSSKWETSKTNPHSFQSAHRRQSWTIRNPAGCRSWKPMAPWYHTTKAICRLWQYYSPIVPYYHSLHSADWHRPARTHQRPRTTTRQEPQKKRIDPKAPKATGKVKNRKDKNPLYYIWWVRIAQWLERWSCKPMAMGSIPKHSAKRQSAIRNKD